MISIKNKNPNRNLVTGHDITVENEHGEMEGIASATIFIEPGEPVIANLRVYLTDVSVGGLPSWVIRHPETGDLEPVDSITLKSGEILEF